jgi:NaMN:DMB phosphoribosyltransferase
VLGLSVIFDMGISHGEGAGAAMALPTLVSAARILCERTAVMRDR